jgi:hypothetical protein
MRFPTSPCLLLSVALSPQSYIPAFSTHILRLCLPNRRVCFHARLSPFEALASCDVLKRNIKSSYKERKLKVTTYQSLNPVFTIIETLDLSPVFTIIETLDLSPVFSSILTMDFFLLCSFHFQSTFFISSNSIFSNSFV